MFSFDDSDHFSSSSDADSGYNTPFTVADSLSEVDLNSTDNSQDWEAYCSGPSNKDSAFHRFPVLPAELRLNIWQYAIRSACAPARAHRITLSWNPDLKLSIGATPGLSDSTRTLRYLTSSCIDARREFLRMQPGLLPDVIPIGIGSPRGILRCNLQKDLILVEGMGRDQFAELRLHHLFGPEFFAPIANVHSLGLTLMDELHSLELLLGGPLDVPAAEQQAFVDFAASFPHLRNIFILPFTYPLTRSTFQRSLLRTKNGVLIGDDTGVDQYTVGNWGATPVEDWGSESQKVEWEGWERDTVDETEQFLNQLKVAMRQAMNEPPVVTNANGEAIWRLVDVQIRLLGHCKDYTKCEEGRWRPDLGKWQEDILKRREDMQASRPFEDILG
ncbi:hypothetical protein QBC46DRAFT_432670 [Diplogelasinospora grovesii]|uniref:2EXR domain-containing protein n=1 Tax=Diplogelasinospora grovesii TaxID=303347 RepID=A0AAN6S5U8_9PEZI|nr:hypothetical protein QBC46DRAFT_432670 [Diplogelasinospora grovesii]